MAGAKNQLNFESRWESASTFLDFSKTAIYVGPIGIYSTLQMPNPKVARYDRYITAAGAINDSIVEYPSVRYGAATSGVVLSFTEGYLSPSTTLDFSGGGTSLPINIVAGSISPEFNFGFPQVENLNVYIGLNGLPSGNAVGVHSIINKAVAVKPLGFASQIMGGVYTYNVLQFSRPQGFNASGYGYHYLQGGVKTVLPAGIYSQAVAGPRLTNLSENRYIPVTGINQSAVSAPDVSPYILVVRGIASSNVGQPKAIPTPLLRVFGADQTIYGNTTIWFRVRSITGENETLAGIDSYATGYPSVVDRNQYIQALSIVESAIFGDTRIRNYELYVKSTSIESVSFSDWAIVTNKNNYLQQKEFTSLSVGAVNIRNKTPSLFFKGIESPLASVPSIGFWIRSVIPTGFDHLLLGTPKLIKTPELLVSGFVGSSYGRATVSNFIRTISATGLLSDSMGKPIADLGVRYTQSRSWQSSAYGQPNLTHGLRWLYSRGFERELYGNPWVSQGTRTIRPNPIYKFWASNHMVGRHRTIAPVSFIATEFGDRIIPLSRSLYPLGFSTKWGLSAAYLKTQYLSPSGFNNIFDRWGGHSFHNLRQYIKQEYDGDSGLVPPEWSTWTLIENRNRVIGVVSNPILKFGYSQIDNGATPLLVSGIAAPVPGNKELPMVSYNVRSFALDGIAPMSVSEWGVVYNAARVVGAKDFQSHEFGLSSFINTRREYRNIGMIDSMSFGHGMVSDRIRTVDIEPRYSIEPPQINLHTVDLYSRYATFRGYETAAYGTPSLSIHFNKIEPKWARRDTLGFASVKNQTPELIQYGHDSADIGRLKIDLYQKYLKHYGDNTQAFGGLFIGERNRRVSLRGWLDSVTSDRHEVIKNITNAYVTQTIWLTDEANNNTGNGYGFQYSKFGRPGLNQNILYVQGRASSFFGTAIMRSNNLMMRVGISTINFSSGHKFDNSLKLVGVSGIDASITAGTNIRVTPSYIIPKSGTQPSSSVSRPKIELSIRYVGQDRAYLSEYFGRATLDNKDRTIFAKTIRPYMVGLPEIPYTDKTVDVSKGIGGLGYGTPAVTRPPYTGPLYVEASGLSSLRVGHSGIENFIRNVYPTGAITLSMGESHPNDRPYMWQRLRVGAPVPLIIGGGDMLLFSDKARVSLRVQEVQPQGFDAFVSEYSPEFFNERLRVVGDLNNYSPNNNVSVHSIFEEKVGLLDVKYGQQYIKPDGNSDQFRKGGYHA